MLLSKLLGERYREMPADVNVISYALMLKGAYIRPIGNGIFTLLPPAKKVIKKIENIIREEMDNLGGQEVLFPVVMPGDIWEESGRYESVGKELLRFKDRSGISHVLAMTHEEAAVHLAKTDAKSYTKYPFMIYQIQTKFRDEPRSRAGLIRTREFTMKDGYSFHCSQEDLENYYKLCHKAYENIYNRCGLSNVVSVGSDSGIMGGAVAHEFMYLCDSGEDTIVTCDFCNYRANIEIATTNRENVDDMPSEIEKIHTPNITTIEQLSKFLNKDPKKMIKAAIFKTETSGKVLLCFIRADLEINESKLRAIVKENILPLTDHDNVDLEFGFCGPYNFNLPKNVTVIYDNSIKNAKNMTVGANQKDYHYTGVTVGRDFKINKYEDISKVSNGDPCPICNKPLKLSRSIEVGNIFQLGTKYTKKMNMTYADQDGKLKNPIMGCYGIGLGRLFACIVEDCHDDFGPIWPYSVAPWQIHICTLSNKKTDVLKEAKELYDKLSLKYEVILDDRKVSAGIQFNDADLLGVPIRIIVSARNLENDQIEIVTRDKSIKITAKMNEIESAIESIVEKIK